MAEEVLQNQVENLTEDNKSNLASVIREQGIKIENLIKEKAQLEARINELVKKELVSQETIRELSAIATKGLAEQNPSVEKDLSPEEMFLKYKKNK